MIKFQICIRTVIKKNKNRRYKNKILKSASCISLLILMLWLTLCQRMGIGRIALYPGGSRFTLTMIYNLYKLHVEFEWSYSLGFQNNNNCEFKA